MKRKIRLSNLAFRFYKKDGWTLELLKEYLVSGEINTRFQNDIFAGIDDGYFGVSMRSVLDKDRILNECELEHCWFWTDWEKNRTQEQIFDQYQW